MNLTFLLCDDHALFREGLAALLEQQAGWHVVAHAADGYESVRLARVHRPDIVVLDIAMPELSGIEAAPAIKRVSEQSRIVALSMYGDPHYRRRMLSAGVDAYVLKNEAGSELVKAIAAVLRGELFISPALREGTAPEPQRSSEVDRNKLTQREREVLCMLAEGRRTKDIAQALGISVKTVETYRSRVMLKLDIDNLVGLVKFAIRSGMVSAEH
ncbi:MAG: response regulator transcription factor [Thiohalocapsa sp.]|nr:response regulator transcription factor [Thiohalocapsa sp.]MCF7990151.1 response regulator transcription factor [Thiohalocapsa sp.]